MATKKGFKENIRKKAIELGASLVNFAPAARWEEYNEVAPAYRPKTIWGKVELSILRAGDHIVAAEDLYGGTYRLFERVYREHGITLTYADGRVPEALSEAIRPETKIVWIETPTNPLLQLVDIEAVAALCRDRDILLVVDSTFATPYLQKPLVLDADVVVHSTTKYINGHSDVVGGAVITSDRELFNTMAFYQNAAGAVPGPFDCWLTLRGIKTLAVRMKAHQENTMAIARYLWSHPFVESVSYPGLSDHPQHELERRQMSGFGGMVSFCIRGGNERRTRSLRI